MAALLDDAAREVWTDPLAAEAAAYLRTQREPIGALIRLAAEHAAHMATRAHDIVLCHADIHAGNVLLTEDGALFVVDWDTIILAPKERDLMFVGGGLMGAWRAPQEEERLFYAGYGAAQVDPSGLAYFRAMRILEDLVLYADELLHSDHGGEDRALALHYLKSNFRPGSTIDLVTQTPA
jgi:spectinomycin phosphotransferase